VSDHGWIEPAVRTNATDQIRTELIAAVRDGRFPVGSKLPSEDDLARRYHVSRPVIREALGSLRVLGLTSTQSGKGTFVLSSDVKLPLILGDISSEDLSEVRLCLEVPATRLAATRRSDWDVISLRDSVQQFARARDLADRVREDVRFHLAIAEASHNLLLQRLVAELRSSLREQSFAVAAISGRRELATAEHKRIVEAIDQGIEKEAADAMRAHLLGMHSAVDDL
jgi:DNA-binding FadR family transcriptional regulator